MAEGQARPKKRKTYAQGRRDEAAAIERRLNAMHQEKVVAKATFETLRVNGRVFKGRGKLTVYERGGFVTPFAASSKDAPFIGLPGWRVEMRLPELSGADNEFAFNCFADLNLTLIVGETYQGQAMALLLTKGRGEMWSFEGMGELKKIERNA